MGVRVYIACVLLFTCLHVTVFGKDCVTKDECSCTFDDDGTVIDITSLGNQDNTPRYGTIVNLDLVKKLGKNDIVTSQIFIIYCINQGPKLQYILKV